MEACERKEGSCNGEVILDLDDEERLELMDTQVFFMRFGIKGYVQTKSGLLFCINSKKY